MYSNRPHSSAYPSIEDKCKNNADNWKMCYNDCTKYGGYDTNKSPYLIGDSCYCPCKTASKIA